MRIKTGDAVETSLDEREATTAAVGTEAGGRKEHGVTIQIHTLVVEEAETTLRMKVGSVSLEGLAMVAVEGIGVHLPSE